MKGTRYPHEELKLRTQRWAQRLKIRPKVIRVQRMTRKWGSCSERGTVSLAADLARQPAAFQDFVVVHELLHLRVPNHGQLFKALMTAHVPGWRRLRLERRPDA